jgi:patatin-like phospholipase/acyl hydrolase
LALDGGGARGYLSAGILKNVELYLDNKTGQQVPLGKRFDLIAGTSAGGIIALGLGLGYTAAKIEKIFGDLVATVFAATERAWYTTRLWSPEYGVETLTRSLKALFGDSTLRDVTTDVCITAVSLENGRPRFHKSNYRATYEARLDELLVDVALATSAAPTYFPAHNLKHSHDLVDGGVCANNPSMIALAESGRFERKSKRGTEPVTNPLKDVVLISIGTGELPSMPYDADTLASAGLLEWAQHISDVMFQSQSEIAHSQASLFLGSQYLRINPLLKFTMSLDDVTKLNSLQNFMDIEGSHQAFLDAHIY